MLSSFTRKILKKMKLLDDSSLGGGVRGGVDMSAEAQLLYGGGINVEGLKNSISAEYDALRRREGLEPARDVDLEEQKSRLDQQMAMITQSGVTAGVFALNLGLQDAMRFQSIPTTQITSQLGGGYASIIGDAIQSQEALLHQYGMIASNSAVAIYTSARFGSAMAGYLKTLNNMLRVARVGKTAARGVSTVAKASIKVPTPATIIAAAFGFLIDYAVITFGGDLVYEGARRALAPYINSLIAQRLASRLFDRNRVIAELTPAFGAFEGFSDFQGDYIGLLEDIRTRKDLGRFGYTYREIGNLSRSVVNKSIVNTDTYKDMISGIAELSGEFGFQDAGQIVNIFSRLTRVSFTPKKLETITKSFEELFTAVAGGGRPQIAQLKLVEDLASFLEEYAFGTKFNEGATRNLSNIYSFMSTYVTPDRMSAEPALNLIRGIDSSLLGGVTFENDYAVRFMNRAGIGRGDALFGVTANDETFDRFLSQVIRDTGVGVDSFKVDEGGTISFSNTNIGVTFVRTAQEGLRLDNTTTQALKKAVYARLTGGRISDIRTDYTTAMLDELSGLASGNSAVRSYMRNISDMEATLTQRIFGLSDVMTELDSIMIEVFRYEIPNVVKVMADMVRTAHDTIFGGKGYADEQWNSRLEELRENRNVEQQRVQDIQRRVSVYAPIPEDTRGTGLSPEFVQAVNELGATLGISPKYLLAVMHFETGGSFDPAERNPVSTATGLIQFMERTAEEAFSTTTAYLASLTQLQQLHYVKRYFKMRQSQAKDRGLTISSLSDVYMAVLFPVAMGRSDDFVLFGVGATTPGFGPGSDAYRKNDGLDLNRDGSVTKGEATLRVERSFRTLFGDRAIGGSTGGAGRKNSQNMVQYQSNRHEVLQVDVNAGVMDTKDFANYMVDYLGRSAYR